MAVVRRTPKDVAAVLHVHTRAGVGYIKEYLVLGRGRRI